MRSAFDYRPGRNVNEECVFVFGGLCNVHELMEMTAMPKSRLKVGMGLLFVIAS